MRPGAVRRYLTVVGIILVVVIAAGVWLKPPVSKLRESIETNLAEDARERAAAGDTSVVPVIHESRDWLIAASHTAKAGDRTYSCVGAFKVTVCKD